LECACGGRFVGSPLDEKPFKVQRFGPAMLSVALLAVVVTAALVFTKFIALAAVLVVWSARRAMRLARRDPELYGGYRTAAATLVMTLIAGSVAGAFAVGSIPRWLNNREERKQAATRAQLHRIQSLLEDYKRKYGSYPADEKVLGEPVPADYWNEAIAYQGFTDAIADRSVQRATITINNFELRSAGPDEQFGTNDDIIMRDGVFYTNAEVKKLSMVQRPAGR
jgi:type II secretory pathway pseudopilin PulG